ncbi:MAG: hypothetical protein R6V15_01960, partial [Desulfotignum sp.]
SAAEQILEAGGLFEEIGEAAQSVDETRLLAERMFYRFKRASTLLRWQAATMKADLVATPELNTAFADVHSVTDQIEQLPANIATERQAIFKGFDDRLQRADAAITNVRAAVEEADTLVTSLKPAAESLNEMITTADTLYARFASSKPSKTGKEGHTFDIREYQQTAKAVTLAVEEMNEMLTTADTLYARFAAASRSKTGKEGHAFDIREYEQTAKNVKLAVKEMNELLTTAEHLSGLSDLEHGMQEVNDSVDGRIMRVADQSMVVMNAFFWRACALLGVLFTMLILYRVISLLLMRHLEKGQAAKQ